MVRTILFSVLVILAINCIVSINGCDVIIIVRSNTTKPFDAQITAPNGKTSPKQRVTRTQQLKFQEKADVCSLGDFQVKVFEGGKEHAVKVSLNGVGRAVYTVDDTFKPMMTSRQGVICAGQCAPLNTTPAPKKASPPKKP